MVCVKERRVKGKKYLYVSVTVSVAGHKVRFEKEIGPADMPKKERERKVEFYKQLLQLKKDYCKILLLTKAANLEYLPKQYAFFLTMISTQYHKYLESLYPSELEKYRQVFEVRYVHNTTALEGNTLTLMETGMVLDEGMAPRSKKLREIHEVENYKRVLKFIRNYNKDLSLDFILKVHEFIQRNIDDETAGMFRRAQIFIKGSKWEPPPAEVVDIEMDELLKWYNENKKRLHPFELAGLLHHKFLQIHPFIDGNGRVGREIMNFILHRNGFPLLIIPAESRQEYMERMAEADDGDLRSLLEFFVKVLIKDYYTVVMDFFGKAHAEIAADFEDLNPEELSELQEYVNWVARETRVVVGSPAIKGFDVTKVLAGGK